MTESVSSIVQHQLDAYNARDLEGILSTYSGDAQLFDFPSTLIACGIEALRNRFERRFQEPNLHAALLSRIVIGDIVIDHERVRRTFPEGPGEMELIMVYKVQHGKIRRAWSLAGPRS